MKLKLLIPLLAAAVARAAPEMPVSSDPSLRVELFAEAPLIRHPIGATFTKDGRLLVIESHTHFRPQKYEGPPHDRILWLEDTDGDGRADKANVLFEDSDMTMDIATAADGSIYLSTRDEILRLTEEGRTGKVAKAERKLVFMDSENHYPHNGLSGLAFDAAGGLYFGMGENMGAAYTLTGSDGIKFSDKAEGGNIWHVGKDGGGLRRVATGFWNPFGVCLDPQGNVFATDNDPDSRPPCRLHHVIEGGDYGYLWRYGRSGLHPFDSWNGELPGTLPMLAPTGEAPCAVRHYSPGPMPQFRGLSARWHGTLLVASWADHTIDSYHLPDSAHASEMAKKTTLIQGGVDFRPVAIAIAPDGSLFVTDWVKRDYELHGSGRVWHITAKETTPLKASLSEISGITHRQQQLDRIASMKKVTPLQAMERFNDADPWRFSTAVTRVSQDPDLLKIMSANRLPYPRQRAGLLLALRNAKPEAVPESAPGAADFLHDSDPAVRLLALKWISDLRMKTAREEVEKLLGDEMISPELFYGAITALGRIESDDIKEQELVKRLKARITDPASPAGIKRLAISILPDRDRHLLAREVAPLLTQGDEAFREWCVQVLGTLQDQGRNELLRRISLDASQPESVRAAALGYRVIQPEDIAPLLQSAAAGAVMKRALSAALEGISLNEEQKALLTEFKKRRGHFGTRPPPQDIAAWSRFIGQVPGRPDLPHGREVFLSPRLGSCTLCHRMEGLGSMAGPELSTIGATQSRESILESILQPSRNIAPRYDSFSLKTTDGQTRLVFELAERGSTHTYVGLDGKPFDIKIDDIVQRERQPVSIMPEGLLTRLTDEEIRDLVAYLESRKGAAPVR